MIEGAVVNVPPHGGRKHPEQKYIQIDTKNILFICGGAFDGIQKNIARRLNTSSLGFKSSKAEHNIDKENLLKYITPQDVKSFGLIPELIGRIPVITYLNPLDKAALRRILIEPKNALIKQYVYLFELDGIELTFDEAVFDFIVDKAIEYKLGARGLRTICEIIMTDAMFDLPSDKGQKKLHITLDYAIKKFDSDAANKLRVA
jgi:ATP-dependent Clp protease ATP-binding subunit ClpX